jgi:hypothetical protein
MDHEAGANALMTARSELKDSTPRIGEKTIQNRTSKIHRCEWRQLESWRHRSSLSTVTQRSVSSAGCMKLSH